MIHYVMAVRDRAVDSFGVPIFVVAIGQAVRSFTDEVNSPDSVFARHPGDYDLYHLGTFNSDNGVLTSLEQPKMVAVGKDLVIPKD